MAGRQEKEVKCSVIAAAQKLFARFGPSKTSVEEIAREAGFSKATVYNYFSGKEAVVAGVIENDRKALIAKLREAIDGAVDPLASLRAFFLVRFREIQRHQHTYRAGREDFLRHMPQVAKAIEINRKEERKLIEDVLRRGVDEGFFRPFKDIHLAADILFTTAIGLTFPIFGRPVASSAKDRVEGLVEFLLAGICSDKQRKQILREEKS